MNNNSFGQYPTGIEKILNASEFLVFCVMYNQWRMMKNENNIYFRSYEELEKDTHLSLATFKRCVKSMKEKGIMKVTTGNKKNRQSNQYIFNMEIILTLINNSKSIKLSHHKEINNNININVKYYNDIDTICIRSEEKEKYKKEKMKISKNNIIQDLHDQDILNSDSSKKFEILDKNGNNSNIEMKHDQDISNSDSSKDLTCKPTASVFGRLTSVSPIESNRIEYFEFEIYSDIETEKDMRGNFHAPVKVYKFTQSEIKNHPNSLTGVWGIVWADNGNFTFQQTSSSEILKKIDLKTAAVGGGEKRFRNRTGGVIKAEDVQQSTATEIVEKSAYIKHENSIDEACMMMYGVSSADIEEAKRSFVNSKNWRSMPIFFNNQTLTISKVLDLFNEKNENGRQRREANTYFFILDNVSKRLEYLKNEHFISDADFNEATDVILKLSRPYLAYWSKVFENRLPKSMNPSEKRMWQLLGCPQPISENRTGGVIKAEDVQQSTATEIVENPAPIDSEKATLPNLKELYSLPTVDDAVNELVKFTKDHPNIGKTDKLKFNQNLCAAFGIDGLHKKNGVIEKT